MCPQHSRRKFSLLYQMSEILRLGGIQCYNFLQKKTSDFAGGATPPRTPPSGPAGAGRVGVITRGGIVDPF